MVITSVAIYDSVHKDALALQSALSKLRLNMGVELFEDSQDLLEKIRNDEDYYSLVFIGVNNSETEKINLIKEIHDIRAKLPVILVSDSDRYYKEAFEVFAYNYIVKPVNVKVLERILYPLKSLWQGKGEKLISFRYRAREYTVRQRHVSYISSNLHTVNFHLADGRTVHCRGKLNDFEAQLEGSNFVRCHQSFFVNMERVTEMKNNSFVLDGIEIPISRSCSAKVHEFYKKYQEKIN